MEGKRPDDFMVWGIAFLLGCVLLFCLPKIILCVIIAGLVLGYATIGAGKRG